ncbi:5840_t:CDS:2 [Racocetra fulgida]|uniref:5840_t:CDS:1 n=1 Tax=Racocetra fulgida TaxID=60492 RepID=A0A9N8Z1Y1_9GLOM|nr:5840_t:CDS:2 [Racocetra fulgida]
MYNNLTVVLKNLNNSEVIGHDFLNEVCIIGDFGISKPANSITDTKEIYGVIPYIAPEIFNGEKYTTASDIYSFGMIMWEMITAQKPFFDRNHDEFLILDILNGLRPDTMDEIKL